MGKTVLLAAVLLAAVLLAAVAAAVTPAPAWAQEEEIGVPPTGDVIYSRGDYVVTEDGFVSFEGDSVTPCSEAGKYPPGVDASEVGARTRRAKNDEIRACQAAGFDTAADVSPVGASATSGGASTPAGSASGSASPSPSASAIALPETGGPALLLPVPLALFLGAGLLAHTIAPAKLRGSEAGSRPRPRSARGHGS